MGKHFGVVLQLACILFILHNVDCMEYCEYETFNASCASSQIIVIDRARYGRMGIGRCVRTDYGYLGCSVDVVLVLDGICSGRRSCHFIVIKLRELSVDLPGCPEEFTWYLEASYSCVTVLNPKSIKCNDTILLNSSSPSHYVQYVTDTDQTSSPSPSTTPTSTTSYPFVTMIMPAPIDAASTAPFCPMTFSTQRSGQRIDVALYSFGSRPYDHLRPCPDSVYVIDEGRRHITVLCPARLYHVQRIYTTNSSMIVVYFGRSSGASKDQISAQKSYGNYLIRVEAVGCPDLVPPPNSWILRFEHRIIIRCNFSMEIFYPTCKRNRWIGGPTNCSEAISREVCLWEPFTATCSNGTVIVIRSALFGRMRSNRCLNFDTRDLGCYANVQLHVEALCNQRIECTFRAYIDTLRREYMVHCLNDSGATYLHVFYSCVHDPWCGKFDAPENVILEDIVDGYRVSCMNDRNISWEVRCVRGIWTWTTPKSCPTSKPTDRSSEPSVTEENNNDIQCAKFIPPENVTVEDILNGHRLSCTNDMNISWEVRCINNTWISETSKNCASSKSSKCSLKPLVATENDNGDSTVTKKLAIILPCVTAVSIIFLAAVSVYIYKWRQRKLINNERGHALSMLTESDE